MLDFVPNHTAPDHPWVRAHPDHYVQGDRAALASAPDNYVTVETVRVRTIERRIRVKARTARGSAKHLVWQCSIDLRSWNSDLPREKRTPRRATFWLTTLANSSEAKFDDAYD
jgi:hypothetical protein